MSDPLSITASIIAILQLGTTAINHLRSMKNGAEDRVNLRDELRSTNHLLEMIRDRIEDAQDENATLGTGKALSIASLSGPDNPLILFKSILEDIVAKLIPQSRLRQRSLSLLWPFTKQDIAEKLACLERLKSNLSFIVQNDLMQLALSSHQIAQSTHNKLAEIEQKADDTHLRQQREEKQKIMLWLSTHQFRQQHVAILEGVKQGTGEWFVKHDKVQSWFEGKTGLLWCPGLPGAGKTHLMSLVVDTIERKPKTDDFMHAYIYCSYSRRKEQSSAALLSSLLLQVLQHSESDAIPSEVLLLYNSHLKYGTRPTSKQLKGALEELIVAYKKFFVVIDALDECAESEQDTLEFLSVLRSVGSNVHILCSSRSSTTFEGYFSAADKLVILAREEDVGLFLDSEITRHPGLSRHVRVDPTLRQEIITCINAKCQGMFLLAKLHIEPLYNKINRKAVRSALLTLPKTLDDTYSEALQRIYDQPSDTVELAEIVLLWVVCAHQPLTVAQLQHMHAMRELSEDMTFDDDDLPDGEILTGACGGLVSVDGESQTIQLIHYTAQNYFERSFAQKLMAARLNLTQISLAYLGLPNFESGFCTSDADMLQRLGEYPFLEYAAKHWGSDINSLDMDQLLSKVDRVFSNSTIIEMTSQAWSISTSRYSNWSQEFPRNCPALVLASAFEVPVLLEHLVLSGHQVEGKGTDEETALIRAAKFGRTGNVRFLLQKGAEVNSKDYTHETALQKAAGMGHESVVRLLLDGGADVNTKASNSWSPLMSAVSSGSVGTVRMLVEAGANLTTETDWGSSALSMAIQSGQEDIAVFLADQGAILPHGEVGRRTPMIASRRGFHRLVRLLTIDHRAIAENPLRRQASRLMSGVAECLDEASYDSRSDSAPENQTGYEVSFGEFMEQYDIKTGFSRHYKRKVEIGHGGFGTVWLCHSTVTGVPFAVKTYRDIKRYLRSSDIGGIRAEINLLHELKRNYHPNLIRMVDIFANLETNMLSVVLELAPAGDLHQFIVDNSKLGEYETRIIFSQLFSGIQFLHELGWVHRDIKPQNILIMDAKTLRIQLGDMGIAKKIGQKFQLDEMTLTAVGTLGYLSPEVFRESIQRQYAFKIDVWSAGVALYVCLCGFQPFSYDLSIKGNPFSLRQQIMIGKFDYPSPDWDSVGDPALDLIDRMLIVDVTRRASVPDCQSHPWCGGSNLSAVGQSSNLNQSLRRSQEVVQRHSRESMAEEEGYESGEWGEWSQSEEEDGSGR